MRESTPRLSIPPEVTVEVEKYLQQPYHKVVSGNAAEGFLVEVMELPGCMTDGQTEAEALANVPEAMAAWLETALLDGAPIPAPFPERAYSGKVIVRMANSLHERLAQQAAREGVSLNQWLVTLLAQGAGAAH